MDTVKAQVIEEKHNPRFYSDLALNELEYVFYDLKKRFLKKNKLPGIKNKGIYYSFHVLRNEFDKARDEAGDDTDKLVKALWDKDKKDLPLNIAIIASILASKSRFADSEKESWAFAAEAMYWAGVAAGLLNNPVSASAMARKGHQDDYDLAENAREHWKANIDPNLSAEKAASMLENIVPLSHKKLASIVSMEKKKLKAQS
ncbi:hypothetical protein FACS189475_04650 [Betaproteobacteria bacterium]|nr:hypothetical protein FACS189475_04650 [Betaproteobacteria bacterium]